MHGVLMCALEGPTRHHLPIGMMKCGSKFDKIWGTKHIDDEDEQHDSEPVRTLPGSPH